ncbi:MAG: alpha-E domain-containing protein [Bryobacteraceae bacterium]|nr:alpha-E domain-containing protein [Bryobacteraceae bacterium]
MLSRVADNLYWMCRYLERAEHTARLIDVHLNLMLDQSLASADQRWSRAAGSLGIKVPEDAETDGRSLLHLMCFEVSDPCSMVGSIIAARENARQVREQISSEMWEQLNRLFHEVRRASIDDIRESQPIDFAAKVRYGMHLFEGITDSTMSHGEGWHFIQLGRFLERAIGLAILLDVHFREFFHESKDLAELEHLEWLGLLKSCTAFEAYCKVYTAELKPVRIAEFLILDQEFPHSVRFAVDRIAAALEALETRHDDRRTQRLRRLAGRLQASLSYGQIEEIFQGDLHVYLDNIQRQCHQIHLSMYESYVTYPIQMALEA